MPRACPPLLLFPYITKAIDMPDLNTFPQSNYSQWVSMIHKGVNCDLVFRGAAVQKGWCSWALWYCNNQKDSSNQATTTRGLTQQQTETLPDLLVWMSARTMIEVPQDFICLHMLRATV